MSEGGPACYPVACETLMSQGARKNISGLRSKGMLTGEGAGKSWLQASKSESDTLSSSRSCTTTDPDGMCAGASSDELLFQVVSYLEAQRSRSPAVPCVPTPPPSALATMHRSPSFSADSGVVLAETERESSNCPPTSDSSVEESSSAHVPDGGAPPSGACTPLESAWMQCLSPDTGGLDLLADIPDEWPAAPRGGAVGENALLAPLDGNGPKLLGVGSVGEVAANEGVDSIWQRISASRGGGLWETHTGAGELRGGSSEGSGLSSEGLGLTGAKHPGAPPRVSRFRPPDELCFSNTRPLQRSSTLPASSSFACQAPKAGATPAGPIELEQLNAAQPVSMELEPLPAAPWIPSMEALKLPPVAPPRRQLARVRAPGNALLRTHSDPARWLQSYESGEGLLGDALLPPRSFAPRPAPLERQRSVPALPVSSALGGGPLQRQSSAPEAEVTELLGEQILQELRRRREGQAPLRGGLAKPKLTPSQMQLILDQHRFMLENQPPEGAWRGGGVLDTVREGVPTGQLAVPSGQLAGRHQPLARSGQLAGSDGQLAAARASARPKVDKRRRGAEDEWAAHAHQREVTRELAEARAALPGGRNSLAGLAANAGHRAQCPGPDGPAAAGQMKVARQAMGSQGPLSAQAEADALFWGEQSAPEVGPLRGAVPLNEAQPAGHPELHSRAFLPEVGLHPAPLPGFETITVPELPRGSSPNELPCAPHARFVVPVGPNLAHVMEIFKNAQPAREVEVSKPLPTETPNHVGETPLVSPRTQLPSWESWAFEEGLADMDFSDTLLGSANLDV
ncbi:hypothetical protein KFL_000430030 [Klebsormidium nitens]|uniref:Uncharacterized protein n=1 Tax=Klebsormidium nitens TaxID=105231 RepID=A0A1Y1HSI8_KLENI|nr:hypothetical protein KFL_000430030 [Klebsormidium nitens]|eukprot:GAQ79961.1 hypothetical protein KFL_000430030 [Klebsormidium nitens]